jgi:hypothetical protein
VVLATPTLIQVKAVGQERDHHGPTGRFTLKDAAIPRGGLLLVLAVMASWESDCPDGRFIKALSPTHRDILFHVACKPSGSARTLIMK